MVYGVDQGKLNFNNLFDPGQDAREERVLDYQPFLRENFERVLTQRVLIQSDLR